MAEQTFNTIAEWHFPNRVIAASDMKTSIDQILKFLPLRCHWCKREMPAKKLRLSGSLEVCCINYKECNKIHMARAPKPLREAGESKKNSHKTADDAQGQKNGSKGSTGTSQEEICGEKHKVDGKTFKCRRKPSHKGKHKDRKGNRF